MKVLKRSFLSTMLMASFCITASLLYSCSDDEPTPIPVEPEEETAEGATTEMNENVYYVSGYVTDTSSVTTPIADATVTYGSLTQKTDEKGFYTVKVSPSESVYKFKFSKEDRVSVSVIKNIDKTKPIGTTFMLSAKLTPKAAPITVKVDSALNANISGNTTVDIPANALKEETNINLTEIDATINNEVDASNALSTGSVGEAVETNETLATINCEPEGLVFDKPIVIALKADKTFGATASHMKQNADGTWEKIGDAIYNDAKGGYEITLNGFSTHAVSVKAKFTPGTKTSTEIYSNTFENIGNPKALDISGEYTYKTGIAFDESSLDSKTLAIMKKTTKNALQSAEATDVIKNFTDKISGDTNLTLTFTQETIPFTVTIGELSLTGTYYGIVTRTTAFTNGTMTPDHNTAN